MISFKEFEEQCRQNMEFSNSTCIYDDFFIDGLCFTINKLDSSYEIETYAEYFDERKGQSVYSNRVIIGNYDTLRQAYNALVKICILNNVEI